MICIVQRVLSASVVVEGRTVGEIGAGMVVLAAVHSTDTVADIAWMAAKLAGLRIFRGGDKHFDLDVRTVGGAMLLVSNFTVAAQTRYGRRPSFDAAAAPDLGRILFDELVASIREMNITAATGEFGADMRVTLVNDGPATFVVDSRRQGAPVDS